MKERIKGAFTKRKILHFLKMALFVVALSLILLSLLGTVAHATGLVDDTINAENLYSKYPLSNYQLDFYVDNSWSWLPWNWLDGIGKSVQYGLYCITNFVWTISLYLSNATGYVVQEAYKLDFINDMADSIGKSIQTLAGVTENGFDDLNVAIQSYNYGGGYVGYVAGKGKKHTFNLAESFAREKSGGKKVTYTNPIAVAKNGGWRYQYGNQFYVELVNQYLTVPQVSGELAQKVMNEALKYQGWKYVYGGSNPNTSFDCSGLTQWCYGKAGVSLPRTAQAQYDATQHLPLSQAKAGDLVFFHSTYNAGSYVTHVGILVSPTQMYHAGNPIGYADLNNSYWQQHLIGAGRVKQ